MEVFHPESASQWCVFVLRLHNGCSDADSHSDINAYSYIYPYGYVDSYSYSYIYADGHGYIYSNSYCDIYADSYSYRDIYANANTDCGADMCPAAIRDGGLVAGRGQRG